MKRETIISYAIRYDKKGFIGGISFENCLKQLSTYIENIDTTKIERGYLTSLERFLPFDIGQGYITDKAIEVPFWINPTLKI